MPELWLLAGDRFALKMQNRGAKNPRFSPESRYSSAIVPHRSSHHPRGSLRDATIAPSSLLQVVGAVADRSSRFSGAALVAPDVRSRRRA